MLKKITSVILAAAILFSFAANISAAENTAKFKWIDVYTFCSAGAENSKVSMQTANGVNYLFLPSGISVQAVPLFFEYSKEPTSVTLHANEHTLEITSGQSVNLYVLFGEKSEYPITLAAKYGDQESTLALNIIPTDGIGSMFLVSDDPVNRGRNWIESSPDKSNKATGKMFLQGVDGTIIYDGVLKQIKGRGNSTWQHDKKPYQIKLDKKTDLLQTGNSENKAKTWVLLANAYDPTLLRNNIVFDFSVAIGMQPGIECQPVNLFYDGEYRGAYLLCEKVEINDGRVDIRDLEAENEAANPKISDFDALSVDVAKTANGARYIYCKGITNPADISGGYLLEMDVEYRAKAEKCYFVTSRNHYIVVKSPEYCSKEQMNYIASYYQELEDTLSNKGTNPQNGKHLSDYVDMDSFVNCYLINELSKNPDGFRTSAYLYKDANSNIMTMGPIWDYDLSFGIGSPSNAEYVKRTDGLFTIFSPTGQAIYEIPEFRQKVHDTYLNKFAPLVSDIILSENSESAPLKSLSAYQAEIKKAAYADGILWGRNEEREYRNNILRDYIKARNEWLVNEFSTWGTDSYKHLGYYPDVLPDAWYFDEVVKATDYGILNGKEDSFFDPDGYTTRAEAAKVLFAISGEERVAYSPIFTDVSNNAWYAPAVMWASNNKIILGYKDHTFKPDAKITRQDFVVLLYRYLGAPATNGDLLKSYSDAKQIRQYAYDALEWGVEVGLLRGYENNTIRPENNVSRAELAAFTVRFYEGFIKQ